MAVTTTIPGKAPQHAVDWVNDSIKVALVSSLSSFVQDTTEFWSTLQGAELATANGYTAGGVTLSGKSINYSAANNRNQYRASNANWTATGAGFSAVGAVVYKDTGAASTSPIVAVIDFGGSQSAASSSTFTIAFDATDGVYYAAPA